jgi:hypothetical protein
MERKGDEKVKKESSSKKTELHFKFISITFVNEKSYLFLILDRDNKDDRDTPIQFSRKY